MQPAKKSSLANDPGLHSGYFPDSFPAWWASDWGEDEFGLWMALTYKGVRQAFRWIVPGTFLMGSPEDEPERYDDETQHPVTLTQGYWLADSACTQALWRAVMGNNPSRFQDDEQNPVEQVSWNGVQQFIDKLNGLIPNLNARLPTEAQWEYACRAGTTMPFSLGKNITPEQVNYDGNYPYANGKKGLYRKKTIPVKSLPPNPWGLYEMHGNVWEWCQDWYGDYPAEPGVDPIGSSEGAYRVLRGGSWHDHGRYVRSADRSSPEPGIRGGDVSFRLSLVQAQLSLVG
jgi:sulfatase modifying factor 1